MQQNNHKRKYVYLTGGLVLREKATLSIDDRGFRFGDGVFETIRIYDTIPYQWEVHMQRLQTGLDALHIDPIDFSTLLSHSLDLIQRNAQRHGILRIVISRGCGSQGYLPQANIKPTILIETSDIADAPKQPIPLFASTYRKTASNALPPNNKFTHGINSTLAKLEATEHNCFEALMLSHKGFISECSSGNIFWLKGETLYTPSLECDCVAGTMRSAILRLAKGHITIKQGAFRLKHLYDASEVFVCNSLWGALPVSRLMPENLKWSNYTTCEQINSLIESDQTHYASINHLTMARST